MRKVKFKMIIVPVWENDCTLELISSKVKPLPLPLQEVRKENEWRIKETERLQKDFETEGIFHRWCNTSFSPKAIIETLDGLIHLVEAEHLQFIPMKPYQPGDMPQYGIVYTAEVNVDEVKEYGLSAIREKQTTNYAEE